ncbi:MAG: type IX secretion system membrane protein PorP/SprF [Bacteroidales bacterium]|jgi:type IX secretion system PorP/SprF family membrane protein|nr:type IX secretion system membrane protein PorP/SprF [Bacteroidales bacterium]
MIGKRIIIYLMMLNLFSVTTSMAQDAVVYSQFYANPLYLNPSLTGSTMSKRLSANYRNQWPSLNNAFTSYSMSYDQYIDGISGGIGVLVSTTRDVGGLLSSTSAHLMYAYRSRTSQNSSINFGLGAGIYQRSIDWGSLVFENPENEIQLDYTSRIAPDFNFGTVWGYKDVFYAGFALHQLTQPVVSFYDNDVGKLRVKYTLHMGGNIFFDQFREYKDEPPKVILSPALVYFRQDISQQINAGMNLTIYPFVFGMWYRNAFKNPDAIIALIGFYLRGFQFGYSYDATISKFSNATGGAHEISLGYRFAPSKLSRRSVDKQKEIPCPKF